MDDRKQRILTAIVSIYSNDGEPVGSNLLSQHFDMAVSSATLRNEMVALTKLGLLEQPHTSAGRVPTTKGYRYFVDNLLEEKKQFQLDNESKNKIEKIFRGLDYDTEKLAQGAAKELSDYLSCAVLATTPQAEDMRIAHFKVVQVGRASAAVLAVTAAGGVLTRVAKVDFELYEKDILKVEDTLNIHLRLVAGADVGHALIKTIVDSLGNGGARYWAIISSALTLLENAGKPSIYFEGQQHLLKWPELEKSLRTVLILLENQERLEELIRPSEGHTRVLFGDEVEGAQIPGICLVSNKYHAGGGLTGTIAIVGPSRMDYNEIIPKLAYFSELLGKGMSG